MIFSDLLYFVQNTTKKQSMFIYSTTNILNINFKYSWGWEYCDMNREKIIKLEY